ncbi:hypothetical protein Poli38472_010924 [Pythium oligandrum]|uniref:Thioredoxin domain-containing protein n=1 Tax=Pythium oligandrum TaxID=41045 RepID=A0A8K1FGN7_PYTOL|nr:hypothetical protein Poli38472_010924 [Pythium oligandrum]|eukprot:TMW61861.1 hypothetical protein Poli38472_010924 [Pythium oligandrum]
MASKFSMVNTSGLFDSAAHVEATDRMQGAMEELKIKHDRQDRQDAKHRAQQERDEASQRQRLARSREAAAAASADDSFIRAKNPNQVTCAESDEEDTGPDAHDDEDDDDDDALLDELEQDPELERLREARLAQLKAQYQQKQELLSKGHGEYREIGQDEFLKEVTSSPLVLVHFYHRDFERCKIMDMHLERLAKTHIECKFLKINAEKAPFFVEKLLIRVLPTVVGFKDGVAFPERVIGFDGLTVDDDEEEVEAFGSRYRAKATDSFPTIALARKLVKVGVIKHSDADEEERA